MFCRECVFSNRKMERWARHGALALVWSCPGRSASPLGKVSVTYSLFPTNTALPPSPGTCLPTAPTFCPGQWRNCHGVGGGGRLELHHLLDAGMGKVRVGEERKCLSPFGGWLLWGLLAFSLALTPPSRRSSSRVSINRGGSPAGCSSPVGWGQGSLQKGKLVPLPLRFHFAPNYKLGN